MAREAIFMKPVTQLKAWELYTGQSIWFFFIGIIFFILKYLIDMTFLKGNSRFQSVYKVVEKVGTGQARPQDGAAFADSIIA
tara:strand:+ start:1333 stop:1578 length:246 start_codon:yes stop_codon:yes gene_type:complete